MELELRFLYILITEISNVYSDCIYNTNVMVRAIQIPVKVNHLILLWTDKMSKPRFYFLKS